jgi:type IV secretory pathway VirB2 component (pilin)
VIDTTNNTSAIFAAVSWLQGTILGTAATIVATIAVAAVGFMMFSGRIEWRLGARTILGCFILFGASTIAAGLLTVAQNPAAAEPAEPVALLSAPQPMPVVSAPAGTGKTNAFDPYAGASVPTQ